jgi:hypothetical protein
MTTEAPASRASGTTYGIRARARNAAVARMRAATMAASPARYPPSATAS